MLHVLMLTSAVGSAPDLDWFLRLQEQAPQPEQVQPRLRIQNTVATLFTATADEPNVILSFDESTLRWNADTLLMPRQDQQFFSVLARSAVESEWKSMWGRLQLDTGELRAGTTLNPPVDGLAAGGQEIGERFTSGAFVSELYIAGAVGDFETTVGRKRRRLAQGLLFDDFATGLDAGWYGNTWELGAAVWLPGQRFEDLQTPSFLYSAQVSYLPSIYERVRLFFAGFNDRQSLVEGILRSTAAERIAASAISSDQALSLLFAGDADDRTTLYYGGVDIDIVPITRVRLRGSALGQWGQTALALPLGDRQLSLRGFAGHMDANYSPHPRWDFSAFGFGLSGDSPGSLSDDAYGGFIAVAPFWTWTGLFFNGGVGQGLYTGRATAAGVNGHGVAGSGTRVSHRSEMFSVELIAAALWPWSSSRTDSLAEGDFYGVETDLLATWNPEDWFSFAVEIDTLWPGSFFPRNDVAYRVLGMMTLTHGEDW